MLKMILNHPKGKQIIGVFLQGIQKNIDVKEFVALVEQAGIPKGILADVEWSDLKTQILAATIVAGGQKVPLLSDVTRTVVESAAASDWWKRFTDALKESMKK